MSQQPGIGSLELRLAARRTALCLFSLACLLPESVPAQQKQDLPLEIAIRWDPADGGPRTAEETWAALEWTASEQSEYEVRYFRVLQGPKPPKGFDVIGRERRRVAPPKYEVTYKMRGALPTGLTPPLSQWSCPLGKTKDRKDETDLVYVSNEQSREAMSRSCTMDSKTGFPPIPSELTVARNKCSNMMIRLKRSDDPVVGVDLKVEEWRLPSGQKIIEVSVSGPRTAVNVNQFKLGVVDKLMTRHAIYPLSDSKTQLGSTCNG